MGKRKKGGHKPGAAPVYGSDDERAYSGEDVPDPTAVGYFQDEVDVFHASRDKVLLDQKPSLEPAVSSSDEEVLPFDSDEDDEEIEQYERQLQQYKRHMFKEQHASDFEEDDEDEDKPEDQKWGNKKSKFYKADESESEEEDAELEGKEALALQKKMLEEIDDPDTGWEHFKPAQKTTEEAAPVEQKITQDLSKLSKKEKLKLLKKESPELLELIDEYKAKMSELKDRLMPVWDAGRQGMLPPSKGLNYLDVKIRLYLNYCVNISFYMVLKCKQTPVQNHPVIGRIVQYRKLMKELETADAKIADEFDMVFNKLKAGESLVPAAQKTPKTPKSKSKKLTKKKSKKKKVPTATLR